MASHLRLNGEKKTPFDKMISFELNNEQESDTGKGN